MSASIAQFPMSNQPVDEPSVETRLYARVGEGLENATKFMCTRLREIAHADHQSDTVTMLMMLEVVGRAASLPENVSVTQLLEALYRHIPEDTRVVIERA
jgi:hypothetical protein